MKRLIAIFGVLLLVGALPVPVMAHGPGSGLGSGQHMMGYGDGDPRYCRQYGQKYGNLTGDQQKELDKLSRKFSDETAQTRNDLWDKSGELNSLLNSPDPDPEKARALQKEISELRTKLAQARIDFKLKARKINPDDRFGRGHGPGMGYGRHMGGYGPGMGYGRHMGGYGPGMGYCRQMGGYGPGIGYGRQMGGYGPGMGYGRHMGGYGPGMGYGRHMGGYGPGMGYGHHMGGYGPGMGFGPGGYCGY